MHVTIEAAEAAIHGVLIGAIGVSGRTVENDHAVAQAGVSVVGVSNLPAHPLRT